MSRFLVVALGGALGAMSRYGVALIVAMFYTGFAAVQIGVFLARR